MTKPEPRSSVEPIIATGVRRSTRVLSVMGTIVTVAVVVAWMLWLRPTTLGGPAGYVFVSGTSMEPTMHTGDLVVTQRASSYRVGDVIAYRVPEGQTGEGIMVIHRIVGGSPTAGYTLQGDNRDSIDLWRPKAGDVVGRQWLHVPGAARWVAILRSPLGVALLVSVYAFIMVLTYKPKEPRRNKTRRKGEPPAPPSRVHPSPPPPPARARGNHAGPPPPPPSPARPGYSGRTERVDVRTIYS